MGSILLVAAPLSGKSVVSKYLEKKYKYVHLSSGDLIRKKAKTDKELHDKMSKGEFIDDNIICKLFNDFLVSNKYMNFVFDGFPRTMNQVSEFENILEKNKIAVDKFIVINVSKDILLKRLSSRVICDKCNHVFNKYTDNVSDVCPLCNGNLISRNDDNEDTYMDRYNLFIKETKPIIDYFKDKYNFYEIENDSSVEELYDKIDYIMKEDDIS